MAGFIGILTTNFCTSLQTMVYSDWRFIFACWQAWFGWHVKLKTTKPGFC